MTYPSAIFDCFVVEVGFPQGARRRSGDSWGEWGKNPAVQAMDRNKDQGKASAPSRLSCGLAYRELMINDSVVDRQYITCLLLTQVNTCI